MEGLHGNPKSSAKAPKFKSSNTNISPLNLSAQNFISRGINYHQQRSPIFDPYTLSDSSDSSSLDSPLLRYLILSSGSSSGSEGRSGSRGGGGFLSPFPLASVENFESPPLRSTPVFKAPVKVEEDVLVMDGILVDSKKSSTRKGSGSSARMRSPMTSSDAGGRLSSFTSSGGSDNGFYKLEKCQSWEDSGTCRFGSKCHFAHGKEELRPSRLLSRNRYEEKLCKSFSSGSCTYGTKCRFVHHQVKAALSSVEPASTATTLPTTTRAAISTIRLENTSSSWNNMTTNDLTINDWSPLDDGIPVTLPSAPSKRTPSKEDVNAHIQTVLFGSCGRKRLPVFTQFCLV